jgi:hypothetical protein
MIRSTVTFDSHDKSPRLRRIQNAEIDPETRRSYLRPHIIAASLNGNGDGLLKRAVETPIIYLAGRDIFCLGVMKELSASRGVLHPREYLLP